MIAIPNMERPESCWECRFRTCFIKVNLKKHTCWLNGEECGKTDCPIIDIVQCKDCKWWNEDHKTGGEGLCENNIFGWSKPTDFCPYGERANNTRTERRSE